MAIRKYWVGSRGPFIYDDSDNVLDPEGLITENQSGIVVDGTIKILSAPVAPEDGLRLSDLTTSFSSVAVTNIDDPSTELNALEGSTYGNLILCHQIVAGIDQCTLYVWDDTSNVAENVPYTVDGSSGQWVAIAGKYNNVGYLYSLVRGMTATRIPFADSNGYLTEKSTLSFASSTDTLNLVNLIGTTLLTFALAKFGGVTHYSEFESDGTLKFNGDAVVWKDIMFPQASPKTTGSGNPTLTTWNGNLRGYTYAVNDAHDFDPQEIEHDAIIGSTATWHIHIISRANDNSDRVIKFRLEYAVEPISGAIATSSTADLEMTIPANTIVNTAFSSNITTFTLPTIARIVYARISRLASSGTEPSVDPIISGLHFHYSIDTVGSRQITTK